MQGPGGLLGQARSLLYGLLETRDEYCDAHRVVPHLPGADQAASRPPWSEYTRANCNDSVAFAKRTMFDLPGPHFAAVEHITSRRVHLADGQSGHRSVSI